MKKLFLSIASLFIINVAFSQYNPEKVNKKAVQLYNQAMERAQDGNLASAAGLLQQAIDLDKNYVDAYLSLAGVFGQIKNYNSSSKYYEQAFASGF